MDQPSTGDAGLSREGKPSSGLQPILSSALFRTFFFFFVESRLLRRKAPGQPGRRLVLPWFSELGVEGGGEKGTDRARGNSPAPSPPSPSSPAAHLWAELMEP